MDTRMSSTEELERKLDALVAQNATLMRRISDLEESVNSHVGVDYGATQQLSPHPSQQITVAEYGGGKSKLDGYGRQVVVGDSLVNKYFFDFAVSEFKSGDPAEQFPLLASGAYITSTALQQDLSAWLDSTGFGRTFVYSTSAPTYQAGSSAVRDPLGTPVEADGYAYIDGTGDGHFFVKPALLLSSLTADPAGVTDGMVWYRSDTDTFKARANGVTLTLGGSMPMPVMVGPKDDVFSVGAEPVSDAVWNTANRAFFIPFIVTEPVTVVKMWLQNAGVVSGNFDIGIYSEAYARLVSSGSTAQAGTDVLQEVNIADTALTPGRYYMALCFDNTTARVLSSSTSAARLKSWGLFQQDVGAVTLPATATPAAMTAAYIPNFGISLRTLVA
jgi:hypothetical protein